MVNQYMPRTFGDGVIHESHIDAMVENCEPLHELKRGALSEEEKQIGKLVADNLVVDGATLQMGKATLLVEKKEGRFVSFSLTKIFGLSHSFKIFSEFGRLKNHG